jgi:hypothetical protein
LTIKNWDLITKMKIQSSTRCFNQPKSFHIIPLDFTYLKCLKMRIWLDESYPPWLPWDQSDMPNHRNWTTSSVNFVPASLWKETWIIHCVIHSFIALWLVNFPHQPLKLVRGPFMTTKPFVQASSARKAGWMNQCPCHSLQ